MGPIVNLLSLDEDTPKVNEFILLSIKVSTFTSKTSEVASTFNVKVIGLPL